jgi:predicted esterase
MGVPSVENSLKAFNLEAQVHGRYLIRPASSGESAPLLVGFHGYGENAERLLEAILEIPGISAWHVVAVQALHPFYNAKTGEVVASWMTKQDRLLAIDDNIRYADRAIEAAKQEVATSRPLVYLGFSQGTAMAYRAAVGTSHPFNGIIALAGDVPPELPAEPRDSDTRVLIGRGRDDDWYDQSKLESDLARLEQMGWDVETYVFDGGHEWTPEFCAACRDFLRGLGS